MNIINFFIDYILVFIVLISVLVFVHELGHYFFAKFFKVKVESFSIGFGKELFGWTDKSGTRWKIAPIPLGGYVKMKGEMLETTDSQTSFNSDSFQSKSTWQKFLIIFAGPLFNLIFAAIIFFLIAYFVGYSLLGTSVGEVVKDGPAYNILKKHDIIRSINGKKVSNFNELQQEVMLLPAQEVSLQVERQDSMLNLKITTGIHMVNKIKMGLLGVVADKTTLVSYRYSFNQSIKYVAMVYSNIFNLVTKSLYRIFSAKMSMDELGGPIKIAQISGESFQHGVTAWLFFMAMLSINLAVINLLPIPVLDGGYLLIYILQAITGKKLQGNIYNMLLKVSFILLITLMFFIIFNDVKSLLIQ